MMEQILGFYHKSPRVVKLIVGLHHGSSKSDQKEFHGSGISDGDAL